jgi:hypothetical protein
VCAIQDRVVNTENYRKYTIKDGSNDSCRWCNSSIENFHHTLSRCKTLTHFYYKARHDNVADYCKRNWL